MALTADMVTIDCADPRGLARFWGEALDYSVVSDWDGEYLLLAPSAAAGRGPRLGLQKVPEPFVGKNRVHLDLRSDDLDAEIDRLVQLGARVVATHQIPGLTWTVLADPEGTVFCVGSEK
jgi:predicted enzyme related to lactoylglutathione lyase